MIMVKLLNKETGMTIGYVGYSLNMNKQFLAQWHLTAEKFETEEKAQQWIDYHGEKFLKGWPMAKYEIVKEFEVPYVKE